MDGWADDRRLKMARQIRWPRDRQYSCYRHGHVHPTKRHQHASPRKGKGAVWGEGMKIKDSGTRSSYDLAAVSVRRSFYLRLPFSFWAQGIRWLSADDTAGPLGHGELLKAASKGRLNRGGVFHKSSPSTLPWEHWPSLEAQLMGGEASRSVACRPWRCAALCLHQFLRATYSLAGIFGRSRYRGGGEDLIRQSCIG